MKETFILLTIFLKIISGKIIIDILSDTKSSDVTINYSGSEVEVVSENEIELFEIDDRNLKEAVKQHYGEKPTSVYLKSPTPWGDLYEQYHWEQIKRVLSIKSARVKSISNKPVIVLSQDFYNFFNNTIKVNTGISQTVENSITTSWSKSREISVSQDIEYDINVLFGKFTANTGFSYSTTWGESQEKSETVTIGTTSSVETELAPGQAATAVLSATISSVEIEVVYMATLRGNLAVNFKNSHNGHHFWGPPIENVMRSGGLTNEITTIEIIKIGFYADGTLKVFNKSTGKPL